jgi:hypothetical protein
MQFERRTPLNNTVMDMQTVQIILPPGSAMGTAVSNALNTLSEDSSGLYFPPGGLLVVHDAPEPGYNSSRSTQVRLLLGRVPDGTGGWFLPLSAAFLSPSPPCVGIATDSGACHGVFRSRAGEHCGSEASAVEARANVSSFVRNCCPSTTFSRPD